MFVATMSHEIRTPLTTILGTAELLGGTDLDAHQTRLLDMLRRSGGNLRRLVEDLLDFSRLTTGQGAVERGEFDLPALVAELVENHAPRAQRCGVALVAEVDRDLPRLVKGDRRRVLQVLTVLVDNALKFTHAGHVVVSASPDRPGVVRLAVADTGIGIAPEDQGCVFDSFVQVDGSATRRYEGTGLGLAIGKELTELMGGTLTLRSELAVGSTFTVLLPLPAVREAAVASAQAGRASSASTREARSLGENGLVM
jgi:signal transduction histidine kinase